MGLSYQRLTGLAGSDCSQLRVWLVDGLAFAAVGFLLFLVWVWGVHGQFEDWPKYAGVTALGSLFFVTQPGWRGGVRRDVATAVSVRRAFVTLVVIAVILLSVVLLLRLFGDFSRGWLLALFVLFLPCLIGCHVVYLRHASVPLPTHRLFGLDVSARTRDGVVEELDRCYSKRQMTKVAFANANTLNLTNRSEFFRIGLSDFLVYNDGIGIDIASRIWYGRDFPENLNGTDLVPFYLDGTRHAFRIFLLGAEQEVVSAVADELGARFPRHLVVGYQHGFFEPSETPRIRDRIKSLQADMVIVALGSPKQEIWIAENAQATGAVLLVAVGGLFDFVSGRAARAPLWMRRWRLEWVYRLGREPRRLWRRYLVGNVTFLRDVLVEGRQ